MSRRFAIGDRVRVQAIHPPGHVRTPFYTRGRTGEIAAVIGPMTNAESLAYGRDGRPEIPVYRVRFPAAELWPGEGNTADHVVADLYEHWLEPAL